MSDKEIDFSKELVSNLGNTTYISNLMSAYTVCGWWIVGGGLQIEVTKELTEEQIKNTEELLGWEWVPN